MNRKFAVLLLLGGLAASALQGVELGVIGGPVGNPQTFVYGFSVGSGLIVPMLKIEFEGFRLINEPGNYLTVGVKLRPKIGKIAPYGVLGAGVGFDRLNFNFDEYRFFTLYGFGTYLFMGDILAFRVDIRWIDLSAGNRFRLTAGIYLSI